MSGGIFLFERIIICSTNKKYRQLLDENWTHVEQLKSTDKRKEVLEDSNHMSDTQENDML